jgi:sulfate-transporting ATPase
MAAEKIIFQIEDLHKFYGQTEVLKGIYLSFLEGAKIGVIGPNGAGKSTLLRIIAGIDKNFEGMARPNKGLSIGYLDQEPELDETLDVAGNLDLAVKPVRDLLTKFEDISNKLGVVEDEDEMYKLLDQQAALQEEIDHKEAWELDSRLEQAAGALCLPPMDADVTKLSGGERRRVALCQLLMSHPDLLLLDEPTNHLDADTVEWLEHFLGSYAGAVILITHDRYFLDNVVGWMLEVERGMSTPYKGNYSDYLEAKQKRLDVSRQQDSKRAKVIARELEWIRRTPAARQTRSKARLQRYQELVDQQMANQQADSLELRIPPGPRLGDKVIEVRDIKKGYGDRTLIDGLTFDLPPGAILGIVGANGVGKSTLLKMILGIEQPDSGDVNIGATVQMRFLDQSRTVLDDNMSVFNNITDGNLLLEFGTRSIDARAYVSRFNFKGEDQQKLLSECSGGMRNRVLLAKMLREPANVIIRDEPTNDLDLDTLRVLEEAMQEYIGSAIVVSHDRYFLNRVATHILAFEPTGHINFHHGDYETYHEWRINWKKDNKIIDESKAGKYRKFNRA